MSRVIQPKLRFPEFNENWTPTTLGSIAQFSKGKGVSKSDIEENGSLECIRYGELYTEYGEVIDSIKSRTNIEASDLVLSEKNDVIIPASGETQIDIATASCVMKSGVALGGDLNIIKSPINGVFLSYYLNNKKKLEIASIAQGISVVHLYASQLKTISINVPNKDEQDRIANLFRTIDNHISILKRKKVAIERYKTSVIQQIFSQKIRFKDERGNDFPDWEEKKLGDLSFKAQSGGTPNSTVKEYYNGDIPFLSISDMTSQGKYLNQTVRSITNEGLKNSSSWIVPSNSLIYSMYASVGFVSINKIPIATSQAVMNIILKKEYELEFVYYYLVNFQRNIYKFIETGTQGNINAQIVKNIPVPVPSLREQKRISVFLADLDDRIDLMNVEINQANKFKIGLFQKMFI